MRPRDDSARDPLTTAQEPEREPKYDDAVDEHRDAGWGKELRTRWADAQAAFVDDPRRTVDDAHRLVAEAFEARAQTLGTEDMRVLVQRYREIFDTLVTREPDSRRRPSP